MDSTASEESVSDSSSSLSSTSSSSSSEVFSSSSESASAVIRPDAAARVGRGPSETRAQVAETGKLGAHQQGFRKGFGHAQFET